MKEPESHQTVLVADDDVEWPVFVRQTLGDRYRILSVATGEDALRLAEKSKPDVIILDVMMPGGKDGFATFCDLKKNPETCKIPVVMLTQVNEITKLDFNASQMEQFLGVAPEVFLEKPVSPERLLEEIQRVLARADEID